MSSTAQTPEEIKNSQLAWLKTTRYAASSLEQLAGGNSNFIYKADLSVPLEDGTIHVLVKHGEGFMAIAAQNRISTARCQVEVECMKILSTLRAISETISPSNFIVKTPQLYLFDQTENTQVLEYIPNSTNLKSYIITNFSKQIEEQEKLFCYDLGKSIGQYIAAFHAKSDDEKLREVLAKNSEMQEVKRMCNFDWLVDRVSQFPSILEDARGIFEAIREEAGSKLRDVDGLSVIHGDLCPQNFLLHEVPFQQRTDIPIFSVDWESAQLGLPALDHGEMLGELYALYLYKNITAALWIMKGYISGIGRQSESEALRTALHVGVHLLSFASYDAWGTAQEIEFVVQKARDIVVRAWVKNREWFEEGDLKFLFENVVSD